MILRRIREHVELHNWFAVGIDLAIVIVGVFLGTQATNWNQARLDRERGRESRTMLIDDLQSNQQNLDQQRRYYHWVHDEGLKTLGALGKPTSSLGQQFLIDAYQASQTLPWAMKRNTYDQMIAAGDIANIGDAELRDKVTNFYATTESTEVNLISVPAYKERLRRTMPYLAQAAIRRDCAEKITDSLQGETEMTLPTDCSIRLDSASVRGAVAQVHDAPGLSQDLNRLLVDLDQKLISVDLISRRATVLQQALKDAH
jgi:hypothetical protein